MTFHSCRLYGILALALLGPLSASPSAAQPAPPIKAPDGRDTMITPPEFQRSARSAVRLWLIPRYQGFQSQTKAFEVAHRALCSAPTQAALKEAKAKLAATQLSWAAISLIKFGPINKEKRQYRVYFWPDKHGTGTRQLRRALKAKDFQKLEPKTFREQSAALQGLGPAEKLLYGDDQIWLGTTPENAAARKFSCQMLSAITANLGQIASEVIGIWQQRLAQPAKAKKAAATPAEYDNRDELYYKLIKAMLDESELISFIRLGKVLGSEPKKAKPKKAEAYRQKLSIPIIKASLASFRSLLLGEGSFKGLVEPFVTSNLNANINQRFDRAVAALDAIPVPLDQAVRSDWKTVQKARFAVNDLVTFLGETIALKAGIVFSFNALDGD